MSAVVSHKVDERVLVSVHQLVPMTLALLDSEEGLENVVVLQRVFIVQLRLLQLLGLLQLNILQRDVRVAHTQHFVLPYQVNAQVLWRQLAQARSGQDVAHEASIIHDGGPGVVGIVSILLGLLCDALRQTQQDGNSRLHLMRIVAKIEHVCGPTGTAAKALPVEWGRFVSTNRVVMSNRQMEKGMRSLLHRYTVTKPFLADIAHHQSLRIVTSAVAAFLRIPFLSLRHTG